MPSTDMVLSSSATGRCSRNIWPTFKAKLPKLAANCSFDSITPNKILRDRLGFGRMIQDNDEQEQLLKKDADIG